MDALAANVRAAGTSFRLNQIPIDSDDPFVSEPFQRFWKYQIACPFVFLEPDHSKFGSSVTPQNRHDPVIFDLGLEMPVLLRLLPEGVRFGFAGGVDHFSESFRFRLEELQRGVAVLRC
jgi:hypothetical protein